MPFQSYFTNKQHDVNPEKHIYLVNNNYQTHEFQEKHKFAFGKILMESYKEYKQNDFVFDIPNSIEERTWQYLALSSDIYQWFIDNYTKTNNKNDVLNLKIIYREFVESEFFRNLTKPEKRKYTENYFKEYFIQCPFLEKYVSYDNEKILAWKLK